MNTQSNKKSKQASILEKSKKAFMRYFTFHERTKDEAFVLSGAVPENLSAQVKQEESTTAKKKKMQANGMHKKPKPVRRKEARQNIDRSETKKEGSFENLLVAPDLTVNKEIIEKIYVLPKNKDIVIRDFFIQLDRPIAAFAVFIEGISDRKTLNDNVLKPLMLQNNLIGKTNAGDIAEYLKKNTVYGNQADIYEKFNEIIPQINYGSTAIFIEGSPSCLVVETKGWDRRSVGKSDTEQVIRGPHEAFNETLRSNTGLLRKAIRNPKLITELIKIGERNKTDIAIMYIEDLANPSLVEEVKRRLNSISTDYVGESGILEQFIEDHPLMPLPQVLATERPDRVASFIMDGKVAIILDGNPNVLIVPANIFALLHSPEDYYLRMPYGNLARILRVVAVFITLLTPAFYVGITIFHQEMIPTDLILAIAAGRETVPFPTIIEVFFMEFAFEMIREAGVRVPGVIGNTLGIVGALILGQAAVQAGIVSPVLIIIVALTGLASFAIPNYSMSFAFRGIRFIFTALSAFFGFIGITAGLFVLLSVTANMKSFGVPMMAPIGPRTKSGPDIILRGPVWSMEDRPDFLETQERRRQPNISRGWTKNKRSAKSGGEGDK